MRSVVVVLPASMCAMMPIFRHRSKGTVLDTAFFLSSLLTSCSPIVLTGLPIEILLLAINLQLLPSLSSSRCPLRTLRFKALNCREHREIQRRRGEISTTDNARRPCSLPPYGAHLLSS